MKLPAKFQDLIDQQEALEAHRTRIVATLNSSNISKEIEWERMISLQIILVKQAEVARALLLECATLTCENVEWPNEIRA